MKIFSYIRSHAVLSSAVAIIAVIIMIIAGRMADRKLIKTDNQSNIKKVSVVDVSSFQDITSKVSADGIVESVSQVDLRSQISAPISIINVGIGDTVHAGQTIAILQNADVRALLDQAKAGLQVAQGQYQGTGISLESAKKTALETTRSAYLTGDEAINIQLSQFLYERTSSNPSLSTFITDRDLDDSIRNLYLQSRGAFKDWKEVIDKLDSGSNEVSISNAIDVSQKNLQIISSLLDEVSKAITEAVASTASSDDHAALAEWQATVSGSRSAVNNVSKSLTSAEASLSSAGVSADSPAEAQITSAQASVRNLEAQLAKTIITSPISGKIAELPLRAGELAQPGQLIATVVGSGGLQVKAYASGEDLTRLKVGSRALIQNSVSGVVTSVAPSVSQINRKVELKISVSNNTNANLVIGQNVNVLIDAVNNANTSQITSSNYLLPIQNVKIIPGSAYVFTVDEESKLVKHPVIIGKVQGDFVEIISGISSDMKIVSPVYELEEGEEVSVQ